jgi:hypothetical protein
MTLFAENIPQRRRKSFEFGLDAELLIPGIDLFVLAASLRHTGQVALDIGHENRNTSGAETLGKALKRDGFTRTGRAGYHTVAIRHLREKKEFRRVVFCN